MSIKRRLLPSSTTNNTANAYNLYRSKQSSTWFVLVFCYGFFLWSGLLKPSSIDVSTAATIQENFMYQPTRRLNQAQSQVQAQLSPNLPPSPGEPVNVLFCLHGGKREFINEWEVAFKSVLMNAPLDVPLHVYIIANPIASIKVKERVERNNLTESSWRQPVSITTYIIESQRQAEFEWILEKALRGHDVDDRVSIGGYYRLLSPLVLPPKVGPVLYMDTDAVILGNLQDLWKHVNKSYTFQASTSWLCSAFMIINMEKATNFWELLDQVPVLESGGDQKLLEHVLQANPEILGPLPPAWDTHMGHGFRQEPHTVFEKRPDGVGMLHFNGNRPNYFYHRQGVMQYCGRTESCSKNPHNRAIYEQTWNLAEYYIKLPWNWAKYLGQAKILPGTEGHRLTYDEVVSTSNWTLSSASIQSSLEKTIGKLSKRYLEAGDDLARSDVLKDAVNEMKKLQSAQASGSDLFLQALMNNVLNKGADLPAEQGKNTTLEEAYQGRKWLRKEDPAKQSDKIESLMAGIAAKHKGPEGHTSALQHEKNELEWAEGIARVALPSRLNREAKVIRPNDHEKIRDAASRMSKRPQWEDGAGVGLFQSDY